ETEDHAVVRGSGVERHRHRKTRMEAHSPAGDRLPYRVLQLHASRPSLARVSQGSKTSATGSPGKTPNEKCKERPQSGDNIPRDSRSGAAPCCRVKTARA